MQKVVWDGKAQAVSAPKEPNYDAMVAEFLISYGRHIPTLEAALKEYRVETLEDLAEKQQEKLEGLPKIKSLLNDVELPLVSVLCQMCENPEFLLGVIKRY